MAHPPFTPTLLQLIYQLEQSDILTSLFMPTLVHTKQHHSKKSTCLDTGSTQVPRLQREEVMRAVRHEPTSDLRVRALQEKRQEAQKEQLKRDLRTLLF